MDNFLTKMHRFTSKGLYHGVVLWWMDWLLGWMDGSKNEVPFTHYKARKSQDIFLIYLLLYTTYTPGWHIQSYGLRVS